MFFVDRTDSPKSFANRRGKSKSHKWTEKKLGSPSVNGVSDGKAFQGDPNDRMVVRQ